MRNTKTSRRGAAVALVLVATLSTPGLSVATPTGLDLQEQHMTQPQPTPLSIRQRAIVPIAAFAAEGSMEKLKTALSAGLDHGLTVNEIKEVLVQVYAYAGFPRSLNALTEFMKVLEARKQLGVLDEPGREPSQPGPTGADLLRAGTANQTRLVGGPVQGPLFDFAPAMDQYLKTHLFGDIFERDNLDWQSREIATVAMLAALSGTEAQLRAHVHISRNVGITEEQLRQLADTLDAHVGSDSALRTRQALAP